MEITSLTVAGAGVLGSQIAFQAAYKGFDVTIWVRSEASIERALPKFERLRETYLATLEAMKTQPSAYCPGLIDSRHASEQEIDACKLRAQTAFESIVFTTSFEDAGKHADVVIEAIAEDPDQKREFYEKLSPYLGAHTILATNSSTMLPSEFAQYTGRPERFLALHFANNIWRSNTAEVMGHPGTDPEVFEEIARFAEKLGMVALRLHKEQPGYILNSLLVPFLDAAQKLLALGVADPHTIDMTWKISTGAPMGPFQILDIVGLTTAYNIVMMKPGARDPETIEGKVALMLKERIDAGKTGVAAGEGFYSYN